MPTINPTRAYLRQLRESLHKRFLEPLNRGVPEDILSRPYNIPLIRDEKQMKLKPLYSPACDVAIGPYSFAQGNIAELYEKLLNLEEVAGFVEELQDNSLGDGYNRVLNLNRNPRCLMAFEVENSTAKDVKHVLGSITNCSILSKIGIVVIFNDKIEYSQRLLAYLAFAKRKEKAEKDLFGNVFVIEKSRLDRILQ